VFLKAPRLVNLLKRLLCLSAYYLLSDNQAIITSDGLRKKYFLSAADFLGRVWGGELEVVCSWSSAAATPVILCPESSTFGPHREIAE
jgi:phage gp36-like protein